MTTQQPGFSMSQYASRTDLFAAMIARITELEAARFAYASEFAPTSDGDPDVSSIHANIRALKVQLAQRFDAADMATAAAQGFRDGVASVSAGSEPVAWQYCSVRDKGLWFDCTEERAKQRAAHPDKWDVRYLYTTPPAKAADSVLYDPKAVLETFNSARAGSDKPLGYLRGILAVIAHWESRPEPHRWMVPAKEADSVLDDAALWHWIAEYLVGTRTDLDDEIVASETVNDLRKLVEAATKQPGDVVAYLDVGAGGYLDLGSELSEDALQQLPKGRHALVIAGTYGIDGYVAAPQPSPTAQADSVQEDAMRYRWLREGNDAKHGAAWHVAVNLYGCEWDAAIDAARKQGASHDR